MIIVNHSEDEKMMALIEKYIVPELFDDMMVH